MRWRVRHRAGAAHKSRQSGLRRCSSSERKIFHRRRDGCSSCPRLFVWPPLGRCRRLFLRGVSDKLRIRDFFGRAVADPHGRRSTQQARAPLGRVAAPELRPAGGRLFFFTSDAVFRCLLWRAGLRGGGERAASGRRRRTGRRRARGSWSVRSIDSRGDTANAVVADRPAGRPRPAPASGGQEAFLPSFLRGSPAPSAFAVPPFEKGSPFLPRSGGEEGPAVLFWLRPLCRASILNGSGPPILSESARALRPEPLSRR
jgi:hypothetical protein